MKPYLILFLAVLVGQTAIAQDESPDVEEVAVPIEPSASSEPDHYTIVEDMPEYPGGTKALLDWVVSQVQYPEEALKKKLEGVSYISYIVEVDGTVSNVKVVRGSHEILDKEAVRVVSLIEGYEPGMQRGKPVRVSYTLPVRFKL